MTPTHRLVLSLLLGFLGISLLLPGVIGVFRPATGRAWLVAETVDAMNHLRALNAMMAALGLVALWACLDPSRGRPLVLALGIVMAALVVARLYAIVTDGVPGAATWLYLGVEGVLAAVFLGCPPPPN